MGFSLKKAFKSVAKVATTPLRIANSTTQKALNVTGLDSVTKAVGIDVGNLTSQTNELLKGNVRTGSDQFKTAAFDAVKLGAVATGVGGVVAGTTAAGTFALASKAQQGGGISLGDLGGLAGVPTGIGGIDLGNFNVVKPKTTSPISEIFPDFLQPTYSGGTGSSGSNSNLILIVFGVIAFIGMIFLLIRKRL